MSHFVSIRIPFVLCQSALLSLWYVFFQHMTLKSKVKVIMSHNNRFTQFHRTSNSVNSSSGFRDIFPQIWTPMAPDLTNFFFYPWAIPYGAKGQMTMTLHNSGCRQFYVTSNRENPSSKDMRSTKSDRWPLARLTNRPTSCLSAQTKVRQNPTSPEGWGQKRNCQTIFTEWYLQIASL